jgi:Ca2+/Na+ antiporter
MMKLLFIGDIAMLKVLFYTLPGQLSVLCLVLIFVIMGYLWTYFYKKSQEKS